MSDSHELKLVSWNINGLRAVLKKEPSFREVFDTCHADVFALQETKLQERQLEKLRLDLPGYTQTWNFAKRPGYSGTAVFSRCEPLRVIRQIGSAAADDEGRVCALEFPSYWFVCVYTPNAKDGLARIDERLIWDAAFCGFLKDLTDTKPVVCCGDFNVAHEEIDLVNPSQNRGNAGFSDQERTSFTKLLDAGFTDTFRALHPDQTDAYSWWSYRTRARTRNAGWRIDYFLVSNNIADRITDACIRTDIFGSDHCPVELDIML